MDAIFQACLLRFRPIMMTTMAALFAGLPLAFGGGTGAELRRPLGITIIGGLIVQPTSHAVHDTGYLSRIRSIGRDEFGRGQRPGSSGDPTSGGGSVSISSPFIHRPVATTLLTIAVAFAGALAYTFLAGVAAAASGVSHDPGFGRAAWRQSGNNGCRRSQRRSNGSLRELQV